MRHPIVYEYVTPAEVNILLKKKKKVCNKRCDRYSENEFKKKNST